MSFRVIAPGPLATVQDRGRPGYRSFGVPISGPFDRFSAAIANALVGNTRDAAVLELTGFGGTYEAESTLALAIAGASMPVAIRRAASDRHIVPPASFTLHEGDRLIVGRAAVGFRAYLAVLGGWDATIVMGSRSSEQPLRAGDVLRATPGGIPSRRWDAGRMEKADMRPIRVMGGPDADRVDLVALTSSRFVISSRSDRMGLRLDGDPLAVPLDPERLSTPVSFGAIQMAGGLPIILGPAGGTMGGYPHAAQVISADLDRLGQLRPGQKTRFVHVALEAARPLDRQRSEALRHFELVLRTAAGDRSW